VEVVMAVEGGEVCSSRAREKWRWDRERKGKAYELLFVIPSVRFIVCNPLYCSTHDFLLSVYLNTPNSLLVKYSPWLTFWGF